LLKNLFNQLNLWFLSPAAFRLRLSTYGAQEVKYFASEECFASEE